MNKTLEFAAHLHENVPPDWYETSVKINLGQRYWHKRRFEEVGKMSERVDGKILDIGSADGFFTNEILRLTKAKRIEGIDVLQSSVDYANKRYKNDKRLHFSLGDGHKLKFKIQEFEAVYCLEAMEHVQNPLQVLKQIYKVLKPKGYAIILVPAENWLFRNIVWPIWTKWRGKIWQDTHLHHFDHTKLQDLMQKAGFEKIESKWFLLGMLLLVKAKK